MSLPTGEAKPVLVTGASRGLGLAIARRLLEDGYAVLALSRSRPPELEALAESAAGRLVAETFDVGDIAAIPALARRITDAHGPLYGLINNAALGLDGLLATQHASEIETVMRVNLLAPIHLAKYFGREMLRRREGRIVQVSSIIARTGFSGLSVYGATKAGLEGFTRSLSREMGRAGITVNCVAPGYMETEMTASLQGDKLESIRRRAPLGLARVEDVAGAVSYLLSPAAARITGSVITVDGGSTA